MNYIPSQRTQIKTVRDHLVVTLDGKLLVINGITCRRPDGRDLPTLARPTVRIDGWRDLEG